MLDQAEIGGLREGRRWTIASAEGGAGLRGLSIQVDPVGTERDDLVLVPGAVRRAASGSLVWCGDLRSRARDVCRHVAVEIRLLDRCGRRVGGLEARAAQLGPGAGLALETPLDREATRLQVRLLRWRTRDIGVELGPLPPQDLPLPHGRDVRNDEGAGAPAPTPSF